MTVTASETRRSYTGNGASTAFAYGYKFFKNTDLIVYLVNASGVLVGGVKQVLDTDYSVTGAGSPTGGTVTFAVAPPLNYKIIIINAPDAIQDKDYVNADDFPAESHEEALDRLTKLVQRIQDQLKRVASIPDISDALPPDPAAIVQAAADALTYSAAAGTSATAAAASQTAAAASASAASTSQTAAAASASAASTSATAASTSATNAASSASAAATSATAAASSASAAATSATSAATSATNAGNSATAAATSATNAGTSATAASTSASAASTSAALAADWASKTNGQVASTDYSAKAWAIGGTGVDNTANRGSAKDWATKTAATVDGTEYSAKYYSQIAAAAAAGATIFVGVWDASSGSFPSVVAKGSYYLVSVAGTVNGIPFDVGDQIFARIQNPSTTTYAGNWIKVEGSISGTEVTTALGYTPMRGSNNLSEISSASTARSNLGLGSAALLASTAVAQTANNLSDLANAATARTNLGVPPSTRSIGVGGIATGGGDFTADRTITVPKAAGTDVTTGTDDTKAVTSKALADAGIGPSGVKLLSTLTASTSASLQDTTNITSAYDLYMIVFEDLMLTAGEQALGLQFSTNGGSSWLTSGYIGAVLRSINSTDGHASRAMATSYINVGGVNESGLGWTSSGGLSGSFFLSNPNSAKPKRVWGQWTLIDSNNYLQMSTAGGQNSSTSVVNALKFLPTGSTIASGKIRIYGIKTT